MKTGRKTTGNPSGKLKENTKLDRSTAKSQGSRAKKKHQKSSDIQFANIVEKMHEGFVALDRQMNYIYLNQRGSELLKRKPEDLIGKNYWDEYPQDKDTSFGQAYLRALENQTPITLEGYYASHDRWFENRIYPSEAGLSIFFNDITERKRADEQLHAQETELQEIINRTPFMLTRCSRDLRYLFVSRAYADMISRTPEEVAGKPIIDIMGPEGLNRILPYIEQVLQGNSVEYETEVSFEGVGIPALHVIYTPDYNEAGEVIGWFASIMDITERKRTEQSLTREREILKRLIETMPVMVSMYDPETNSMQLNAEFERIIGWKSEEVSVGSLLEALYPDPEYRQGILQRMAVAGKNEWVEVQVQTRDGRTLDSLWSNVSILNGEQLAAGIALGIDITERKHAEGALQHAREQAEATASRIARLQQITAVLAQSATTTEFAQTILEQGTQAARAIAGIMVKLLDNGNEIKTIAALGYPEGAVRTEPVPLSESTPISDCIRIRQAVWITSQADFANQYPSLAKRRGGFGLEATLALPLIAGDRVLGALAFSFVEPHEFSNAEREFFLAVAQQCSQGLEKARSEEALRTSEARLRLATEAAGIFAWELDLETQVYTVADNFAEVLGFSADVLPKTLPQALQALMSEEDIEIFTESLNKAIKNGTDLRNLQYRITNPETGQMVWLEVNAKNIYDQAGTPRRMLGVAQNITESKQTEGYIQYLNTELKARLDEMNTLMNILPIGVWIGNHDCSEITGNPAAYQMMGLTLNSNVSATNANSDMPSGVRIFVEGVEVSPDDAPMQQVARTGKPFYNFEYELLFADGVRKGVYGSVVPLFNEQGAVRKVIGSYMDFTERKQMETALRQSEERFAKFMQYLPGLAWIKDVEGRYVYANESAEKAFRTPREKLYGKTDQEIFPSEVAAQFKQNDEQALMNGANVQVIESLEQADGILHYSLVNKFPIPSPDGKIALIGGTAFDITERRQAEEALRESEERYRSLFDLVPVAVYTCDADGLIQEFNTHAVELWGREPKINDVSEKFCGSFKLYYSDGRFMPHEKSPMARVLHGETLEPSELEIIVERPDGILRNVITTPLPLKNEEGKIMEGINCLYDITERKHAEEALQQLNLELENRVERRTVQLQRANQALEESRKRLQILSQRLVEVQEDERRAIARELHDRVGQSLAALSLNLTIIGNQLSNQANEQVNMRLLDSTLLIKEVIALVRDVMANLRPTVLDDYGLEVALQAHLDQVKSRYGLSILFEKPDPAIPRLAPSIEMTILRITQEALLNIVKHAQADQAALSLQVEEKIISLIIQDNGSGIKSWQEVNRPGSHGLMIMRERAEAVGGNLRISSQPGKGTHIQVDIPF